MKGTTILLLGAATLVAYASAHPYTKVPEHLSLQDKLNFKKSSSNSNSNSYSQSNQDEADVNGIIGGKVFTGSKTSGYSTNGGSHSQSSSFATSSFNGNLPPGIFGGSGFTVESQNPNTYAQPSLAYGNPGTAGLGLSDNGAGFTSGSFSSSYGSGGEEALENQVTEGAQGAGSYGSYNGAGIGSGVNAGLQGGSSGSNAGLFGSNGGASFPGVVPTGGYFGQSGSQPGSVQYWWSGTNSPFGFAGKPSGGCSSNACTLSGTVDLNQGSGGAGASNQDGQVVLDINGGNPFFNGQAGSGTGYVAVGASFGQSAPGAGGSNPIPIDGSKNPFLNGGYSGGSSGAGSGFGSGAASFASSSAGASSASSGSGSYGSSGSSGSFAANAGNPFLTSGSGGQVPQISGQAPTVIPGYSGSPGFVVPQASGSGNAGAGSQNPFFRPGSGSVVITPPISSFPGQSEQGFPSTVSPLPGFPTQTTISGGFGGLTGSTPSYAGAGQSQTGQFPSFESQSTIGSVFPTQPSFIPEQEPSGNDFGLTVSCSGQGRICVTRNLCIDGKVNDRPGLQQVRTGVQQCKVGREVCCTLVGSQQGINFGSSGSSANSNSGSSGSFSGSSGSQGQFGQFGGSSGSQGQSGQFGGSSGGKGQSGGQYGGSSGSQGQFGASSGSQGQSGQFGASSGSQGQSGQFGGSSGGKGQSGGQYGGSSGSQGQFGASSGSQGQSGQFGASSGSQGQSGQFGGSSGGKGQSGGQYGGSSGSQGQFGASSGSQGQSGQFGASSGSQGQSGQFGGSSGSQGQSGQFGGSSGSQGQSGQFGGSSGSQGQSGQFGGSSGSQGQSGQFGGSSGSEGQSGQFGGSSGSQGQSGQSGSSGTFGQSGSYDQSQQKESSSFGSQSNSQSLGGNTAGFGGQIGNGFLPGSTGKPSSGSFGLSGQSGSSGSSGSYDQSQQKESSNFGSQSQFGSNSGFESQTGGFGSGRPSGSTLGTPAPQLVQVTPTYGFKKPTGTNGFGAFGTSNSNGNTGSSSAAGSSSAGVYTNVQKPNNNGGLFGSNDASGEDLSSGEPSPVLGIDGATASNGYLPPVGSAPSDNVPAFSKPPKKEEPKRPETPLIKVPTQTRPTFEPAPITVQVGCAAALLCVEERFCTLEGVISPQPVALTSAQIERRAPLSSCKNPDNGVIGKCCRDPNYVDPWPTGNLPANYSGGFDEQGFPSYLMISKTRPPTKKPTPTKGGFIQPVQPTKGGFIQPVQPTKGGYVQPTKGGFGQQTKNVLPPRPTEKNIFDDIGNYFSTGTPPPFFAGLFPSTESTVKPSEPQGSGESPVSSDDGETPTSKRPSIFGIELPFDPPTFTLPPFPNFQNPFDNNSNQRNTEASNQLPTIIAPHTPGAHCGLKNQVVRPSGLQPDDAAFAEIPWQAMILSTTDRKLLCSGAIVAPNAVLTSAHCIDGLKPEEISIKAGEWKLGSDLRNEEPLPFEIVKVFNVVPHPGYKPNFPSHDIAILFLEHPLKLDQHVDVLCLGDIPQPKLGRKCISTGWGKVVLQVHAPGALMHSIDVDVVPQDECRQRLQGAENQIPVDNTVTCVKAHKQRNNLCQVDVGGPLACDRGDGFYELTGIYSQDTGCLPTNQVATFALIDTNWVKSTLASPPPRRPSFGIEVPEGETSSSSNIQPNFGAQINQPAPVCDCQKSNLQSDINRYLPPAQ